MTMIRARVLARVVVLSALVSPLPVLGQVPAFTAGSATAVPVMAPLVPHGATPELVAPMPLAELRAEDIAEPLLLQPQARNRNRRGVPLMIAGGALFVAGAVVGDDAGTILMLGGAGVGAWGLYVYFGG
jgi:hypothetical protein